MTPLGCLELARLSALCANKWAPWTPTPDPYTLRAAYQAVDDLFAQMVRSATYTEVQAGLTLTLFWAGVSPYIIEAVEDMLGLTRPDERAKP